MDIKNGLILWDEAQIDLRSRDYKFLPREVEYKLQQHRKHGLDMFVASQNIKRIDIILRELANTIFELRRVGKIFIMRQFDLEDIDKATRKSIGVKLFRFDKSLGESFNTMEEIHKSKNPS